jgi:hypothetical protein
MTWRALLLAFALVGAAASTAGAGTVSVAGGVLTYTAAPGEVNNFSIYPNETNDAYLVNDAVGVSTGPGCTSDDHGNVQCASAGVNSIYVDLGDGNDQGDDGAVTIPIAMHGGPGNDQLGSVGMLYGDEGDDYLFSRDDGVATFMGGPGTDTIDGKRRDTIDCQGQLFELVRTFVPAPQVTNCPGPVGLSVSVKHATVKQLIQGKMQFTATCSQLCAIRWRLVAPPKLVRFVHHDGSPVIGYITTPGLNGGYVKLGPQTQTFNLFVNGLSTMKSLGRLKRFKASLVVEAYTGQLVPTTRTLQIQVG